MNKVVVRNKSQGERIHAKKRALERYGLVLTTADLRVLVSQIQSNGAKLVEDQSLRVGVFMLTAREKEVLVAYDRKRKEIITFLDMKWKDNLKQKERKKWSNDT
jgi:hypothetical protein